MQQITTTMGLKEAIQRLETESTLEGLQLKEDFQYTFAKLNPFNIFRSSIDRATSTPLLFDKIIGTILGLATDYLTKKIVVGKSKNRIRILVGSIIQYGVLNILAERAESIKSIGSYLVQSFLKRKEHNTH